MLSSNFCRPREWGLQTFDERKQPGALKWSWELGNAQQWLCHLTFLESIWFHQCSLTASYRLDVMLSPWVIKTNELLICLQRVYNSWRIQWTMLQQRDTQCCRKPWESGVTIPSRISFRQYLQRSWDPGTAPSRIWDMKKLKEKISVSLSPSLQFWKSATFWVAQEILKTEISRVIISGTHSLGTKLLPKALCSE